MSLLQSPFEVRYGSYVGFIFGVRSKVSFAFSYNDGIEDVSGEMMCTQGIGVDSGVSDVFHVWFLKLFSFVYG